MKALCPLTELSFVTCSSGCPPGIRPPSVTEGLEEGLEGMNAGGRRLIVVPPSLGYGLRVSRFLAITGHPIPNGGTTSTAASLVPIARLLIFNHDALLPSFGGNRMRSSTLWLHEDT